MPPTRYMSDYGVLASFTKPPYTTLTAYDLNTGEIKWQVPNGDHPPTIAAGGPANTGGVGARNGIVVTKGGLVFHAGGDGKVRAYDEDTGKVLWRDSSPAARAACPSSYESKGRQYFVLIASQGGRGGGGGGAGRGAAPPIDPKAPIGAIAFALPAKKVGRIESQDMKRGIWQSHPVRGIAWWPSWRFRSPARAARSCPTGRSKDRR